MNDQLEIIKSKHKKHKNKRRRVKRPPEGIFEAKIISFSHEGRGIAQVDGKTTFIDLALKDEVVSFKYTSTHNKYDEAIASEILKPSLERVTPKCSVYGICGGCSLQHLSSESQLKLKWDTLKDHFDHFGNLKPLHWLEPLTNEIPWNYRSKARLGVRYVHKKEKVLVGFRERDGRFVTDMSACPILHQSVDHLILELKHLILSMSIYREIPQIEVAVDDTKTALIFRHLEMFSEDDLNKLKAFAEEKNIWLYLQSKGPDTIKLFYPQKTPEDSYLSYTIDEFDIEIRFQPNDFTQVNTQMNQKMLSLAIKLMELTQNESVLDLFCGLGNFSLPLAKCAKSVVGIEGDLEMTERALKNAQLNGIDNAMFYPANLFETIDNAAWANQQYDKILLDPPRAGALEIVNQIERFNAKRIVYVSCNPATLARDAGILVNEKGYTMHSAGIMDMFPHTTHIESIAVFEK
ncbi:23S rRNA (uracil(1939)-C(5))-methyltransferase RlmD [Thiotrichales bacterium 19S3-7]|nr:23S rRNA (uracil(1939)-C(5))-methyltransferase RlmD [Thiotrichales bacterium 19S3-7]MCF6801294.1 23S rRNA (uracil(1939)-C(5))-methyltransferase RlmD [Thiotrichales bacterium 19S3-11]